MADKKKRGLGRGLDALLGEYEAVPREEVIKLELSKIACSPAQPRKDFDEEKLAELAASIARHGVVQPIIVRREGEKYVIVAGERRFRAAKKAGLSEIPAIVRTFEEAEVLEVSLVENIQRENLNPIEEAAAIRFLMRQNDLTQEEVSARLGKSRPAVANALRLLSLPREVMVMLRDGQLSAGHGRALAGVEDKRWQLALAQAAVKEGWSVRELEKRAKKVPAEKKKEKSEARLAPELYDVREKLMERLGTKVKLSGTPKRGRITIEYFSQEDLERIYGLLGE